MKYALVGAIRRAGLLPLADGCKFRLAQVRTWRRNRRFRARHPDFPTPPPHLAFDAFHHVDWEFYRDFGLAHATVLTEIIRAERPGQTRLDVLEWGCGPGRLIRHLPALLADRPHGLVGADYNPESIAWCRENLPGIEFVENALEPPLPFAGSRFDAVYNFSVFTHLSEPVQLAWAQELLRVLRPGGLLVCTTHGDTYRYLLASDAERERYDAGEVVVQGNYREGRKWYFAIHPEAFVRDRLLAGFVDVRRHPTRPADGIQQDVWAARKPLASPAS